MEVININNWNRKQHYEHFSSLRDPYFAVTVPFDVTKAYNESKSKEVSFFGRYLHDCMKAINAVDAFKLRIKDDQVVKYNVIHASATLMRPDHSFGFSFIDFDPEIDVFLNKLEQEKLRIKNSSNLFPLKDGLDCIHCSALPWLNFTGHKEPFSGKVDSVPKLAFSKLVKEGTTLTMNLAISVNHALVDGYHVGLFVEEFQHCLNK